MASFEELWKPIAALHAGMIAGSNSPSDEEVIGAIDEFNRSLAWRVDSESAAYHLFAAIAPVCACRPDLGERLLPMALSALFSFGYERAEDVIAWIEGHLRESTPFSGMSSAAMEWIRRQAGQPERIRSSMRRIHEESQQSAVAFMQEELAIHSAVPIKRVEFRFEWDDAVLREAEGSILFFEAGQWSDTLASFRTLTQVLATVDPGESIRLVFLSVQPWLRPAAFRHESHANAWHYIGSAEPQAFWCCRGNVVGSVGAGVTDHRVFEENVMHLKSRLHE